MLDVIGSSLIGLLMDIFGQSPEPLEMTAMLSWQNATFFQLPAEPDPAAEKIVEQYLEDLSARGFAAERQGVWIQSDLTRLATYKGEIPMSAASLTKIATTLATLETWGTEHQFETGFHATGKVQDGVLAGDLIVIGSGDPIFVWEEAIAVGNALNKLGIRKVTGNLIVTPNFYMNFYPNPTVAAEKLKEGLNAKQWSSEAQNQHAQMPPGTPRPQVAILGNIIVRPQDPPSSGLLLRHQSLSVGQILKLMNIFSNNMVSEVLAKQVGGGDIVAQIAAKAANVPQDEIQLVNGSGLGTANRVSPRAAAAMLMAVERRLQSQPLGIADLFPVAGRDRDGTMKDRRLPPDATIKTGTLAQVSALAGVLPTEKQGWVWFAIINEGSQIEELRASQDRLLQQLSQVWGTAPLQSQYSPRDLEQFGDPKRIVFNARSDR